MKIEDKYECGILCAMKAQGSNEGGKGRNLGQRLVQKMERKASYQLSWDIKVVI